MGIEEALKWATVWKLAGTEPPNGNSEALAALADEVQRLRGIVSGKIDEIERLREFAEEARRTGNTRLASMAIAVLAVTHNGRIQGPAVGGGTPPEDGPLE